MKRLAGSLSKAIPSYLEGVGTRLRQENIRAAKIKNAKGLAKDLSSGRLTTAQFQQCFPNAINHGQGNFEDQLTGQIWEAHDGYIYRRSDDSIKDILTAINDNPDMSDEEYDQLIAEFNSGDK